MFNLTRRPKLTCNGGLTLHLLGTVKASSYNQLGLLLLNLTFSLMLQVKLVMGPIGGGIGWHLLGIPSIYIDHSIEWKELYVIVIASMTWGHAWKRKRLIVHCDNHAVVDIWHSHTSRNPLLMNLVRKLFFIAALNNFHIIIQHIPGIDNSIADALSRSQIERFRSLAPETELHQTGIPAQAMSLWHDPWYTSKS